MLEWEAMVVILGLGFTGAHLARRLLLRGVPVSAPVRRIRRFPDLALAGLQLSELSLDHPETMLLPRNAIGKNRSNCLFPVV